MRGPSVVHAVLMAAGLATKGAMGAVAEPAHRQLQGACVNEGSGAGDPDPDATCAAYLGAFPCSDFGPGGQFDGMCDKACGHGDACASAPSDCIGAWSTCTASCVDKVYVVTAAETNGGRACPVAHGTRAACDPGEGSCPCADLALPDATFVDCAALVAGTADGCDGVYRSSSVSTRVDELCPATCNSCCADTLLPGEHDCGSLIRENLATCDNFVRFSTFDNGADAGRCDSTCHYCNDRCMDNPNFVDQSGKSCAEHRTGTGCNDPTATGGTSPEVMQANCPYSCGVCSVSSRPRCCHIFVHSLRTSSMTSCCRRTRRESTASLLAHGIPSSHSRHAVPRTISATPLGTRALTVRRHSRPVART